MALEFLPNDAVPARTALTVSQLNRAVAGQLARTFPLVSVRGEIGNFTHAASGHWYFVLKDDAAQVRCVMFRGRNLLVDFAPREGDEVEVRAAVSLYEARGEYQLSVESMTPSGLGRLFEEFLRLKAKLAAEGLFDAVVKRSLPRVPSRIGVVTSLAAAALRDVLTTLMRRAPYARIIVYPVPVQGEGAGTRIATMLDTVSRRAEVDVVLLVRGGGSIEDLWAFNDERVARAIRSSAMPVVVGVGHESDFTIADFAADVRAPTPTAAAELCAPDVADLCGTIDAASVRLRQMATHSVQRAAQRLDYALRTLWVPRAPIAGLAARVQALRMRLAATLVVYLNEGERRIAAHRVAIARGRVTWAAAAVRVTRARDAMHAAAARFLPARTTHLGALAQALTHLDPNRVLARGYSLTLDARGRIVRDAGALAVGAVIESTLARGVARSVVQAVDTGTRESGTRESSV